MKNYINNCQLKEDENVSSDKVHSQYLVRVRTASFEVYIFSPNEVVNVVKIKHCVYCGNFIFRKYSNAIFCGKSCKDGDWYQKNKEITLKKDREFYNKNRKRILNRQKKYNQRSEVKENKKIYYRIHNQIPKVQWKNSVRTWTRHQIKIGNFKKDYCRTCWEEKREVVINNLEIHHFKYIKSLSPNIVTILCKDCHTKLTFEVSEE